MKKLSTILLLSILLSACATTAKYEARLRTYVGQDIRTVIDDWGYPDDSFETPDGRKAYLFRSANNYYMPATIMANPTYSSTPGGGTYGTVVGGQTINRYCNTYFEVDATNTVTGWRWEGNDCRGN